MYSDLNDRQISILNFIKSQIIENGYPPSVREIAKGVGIKSTSTVHSQLNKLEEKGYIRKTSSKNRAIEVLAQDEDSDFLPKKTVDIPIIGDVTAGEPILASEHIEDTFPVPIEMTSNGNLFMLNVQGESMIEAGILDGDLIIVQKQNYANKGDIVVALLEDSATVKTYIPMDDYIMLRPENSSMEPIISRDVSILGKVIGLYRQY